MAAENGFKEPVKALDAVLKLDDFETLAKETLDRGTFHYVADGSGAQQTTLTRNRTDFQHWELVPRMLQPVQHVDTTVQLLGQTLALPVMVSPAGFQRLMDFDSEAGENGDSVPTKGEAAAAAVATSAGTVFALSQHATCSIEDVAAACRGAQEQRQVPASGAAVGSPRHQRQLSANSRSAKSLLWYQSYMNDDISITNDLIKRAKLQGYSAVVVTVDSPVFGVREADTKYSFDPRPLRPVNYDEYITEATLCQGAEGKSAKVEDAADPCTGDDGTPRVCARSTWADLTDLITYCHDEQELPVLVKGVLSPGDALQAVAAGADAIVVSNHGGRQLEGAVSGITALPGVVAAVGSGDRDIPVLLDGGVRCGVDILKALALGARAVMLARPVFWALATHGKQGVEKVFTLLDAELKRDMAMFGAAQVSDITPDMVRARGPTGSAPALALPSRL